MDVHDTLPTPRFSYRDSKDLAILEMTHGNRLYETDATSSAYTSTTGSSDT